MRILLKRMLAIWLLGLAIVCLVAPFPFYHRESRTRGVVGFRRVGLIDSPASRAAGPLAGAVAVGPEQLAGAPALRQALEQRLPPEPPSRQTPAAPSGDAALAIGREVAAEIERRSGSLIRIPGDEARSFLTATSPADWASFRLIYRQHLFSLESFQAGFLQQVAEVESATRSEAAAMSLSFRVSGPDPLLAPEVAPELSAAAVAAWPEARGALEEDRPGWSYRDEDPVLEKDWNRRLASAGLAPLAGNRFVYRDRLFEAEPRRDLYTQEVPHPKLPVAMRLFGLVTLLFGLLAGRGLYAASDEWGTRTSRTGPLVASDAVVLLFAALSFIACLDSLLPRAFGVSSLMGEDLLLTVTGVCILVLGVPLCALFVTAQSLQRVKIDAQGVEVRGLGGDERVAWTEVRKIEVREVSVPLPRAGILTIRPLTRILAIDTDSLTVTIQEPPFKAGKQALLDRFSEHAPEELAVQVAAARDDWIRFSLRSR